AGSTTRAPGHNGVDSTMSAPAKSWASFGSSVDRISTTVFPAFHTAKRSDVLSGPKGGTRRKGSPPGGSTFTTSAPRSARIRPVMAAGSPAMSTTRTPARRVSGITSGGGLLEDVHGAGRAQADDVGQPHLGPLDLAVAGLPAQVGGHLVQIGHPGGADRVALGDEATRDVHGGLA